jgi:hypothetical protein
MGAASLIAPGAVIVWLSLPSRRPLVDRPADIDARRTR